MGQRLIARFDSAARAELARPGTRRVAGWPEPRLPPALRETMVGAAALAPRGEPPEALAAQYCERMPREQIDQLLRGDSAAHALLWRPLEPAATPRLAGALRGLFAVLAGAGLDARELVGVASLEELLAARPTAAELYVQSLFGRGLPLLGAYPREREVMLRDLVTEASPDDVIDLRLSGNLVHELCHGLARELAGPPAPWLVIEAAALQLGAAARRQHVFPETPGEAVPGVSLFVLLGEALARRHGRAGLWGILCGRELGDPGVAAALAAAGWQDWLRRAQPPFAPDALRAFEWIKLADAARAPARAGALGQLCARAREAGVGSASQVAALHALPSLEEAAGRAAWRDLPWWSDEVGAEDVAMLELGVHALLQVHRMADSFQTHPSDPPGGVVVVDALACELSRDKDPRGVFAEPARWLLAPSLGRTLHQRGARRIELTGVTRACAGRAIAALQELVSADGALQPVCRIDVSDRNGMTHPPTSGGGSTGEAVPSPSPDVFSSVVASARPFLEQAALHAAHEIGLFSALPAAPIGPATPAALATTLGVAAHKLAALLDVLALSGVVLRHPDDSYSLPPSAPPPAPPPPPAGWGRLASVLRTGTPLDAAPDLAAFHAHLATAGAAPARELFTALAADLTPHHLHLLDCGGGTGAYTAAFLTAHPTARATLLDRPAVLDLARATPALAALAPRISLVPGDLETAALPTHDVTLMANLLHLHPAPTCAALVARAAAALAPGGLFIVKDLAIAADRSGPPASVLFSLNMALYTEAGAVHPAPAILAWLRAAGLTPTRTIVTPETHAVIARK